MELPEVECVFDTSRSIYCLKPKGSHVGLSGDEIEEVARRCNSHEKLRELARLRGDLLICYRIGKNPKGKLLDRLNELNKFEQALKEEAEKQ